ncbi:MAG: hypothetical protein JEZ08_17615 [Clostridiales bacterium]|nr:hypothetical protein [Clostridiales bacterium]
MLQIISGKFYETDNLHDNPGKGILYSNFTHFDPIKLSLGSVSSVSFSGNVKSHVFDYNCRIEKSKVGGFGIVRTGDDVIIDQLKVILTFGLDSYFDIDKRNVMEFSRMNESDYLDRYLPRNFVPCLFSDDFNNVEKINNFRVLFEKIIKLSRKNYELLITCLKTYYDSLQILSSNFELAYSMLVYCLEALSKSHNTDKASWEEYPKNHKLDKLLTTVNDEIADSVRDEIISGEHYKLYKKFNEFIKDNLSNSFYISAKKSVYNQIKKSDLDQLIYNVYDHRSQYVHSLKVANEQMKIKEIAVNETFTFGNNIFLTYLGLFRLTNQVIKNFIYNCDEVDKELYNWRSNLPNTVSLELAPKYWLAKTNNFHIYHVGIKLNGFLEQLDSVMFNKANALTDLSQLMSLYETLIPKTIKKYKLPMVTLYYLYNMHVAEEHKSRKFEKLNKNFETLFDQVNIYGLLINSLFFSDIVWDIEESIKVFNAYMKRKYLDKELKIPRNFETFIRCMLSNKLIENNKVDIAKQIMLDIKYDYPENQVVQERFESYHITPITLSQELLYEVLTKKSDENQ